MDTLIRDIDDFCARTGMAESRLGLLSLNDKAFVHKIKRGRRVWSETESKVRAFMDAHRS